MQQKNIKAFIFPIIAIFIFAILLFAAGYAYFVGSTSMNAANYQVTLPKVTTLTCSKTDCNVTLTPQMMYNTNTNATTPKATSTCYVNCTCSGTQGAICSYTIKMLETGAQYTPSTSLGTNKEFTAKVTSPAGCTAQNASSTETQLNVVRNKVVSSCSLTVPSSGSVSANVSAEFKWYNLNLDQSTHALRSYKYELTSIDTKSTVTLDPNGGSVSQSTIQVTYGEPYGPLPTPTWSGHTFRGWNGKNLINVNSTAGLPNNTASDQTTPRTFTKNTYIIGMAFNNYYSPGSVRDVSVSNGLVAFTGSSGYGIGFPAWVLPNTSYTIQNNVRQDNQSGYWGGSIIFYQSDGSKISYKQFSTDSYTFTTPANTNHIILNYYGSSLTKVSILGIQLEQGSNATAIEPFYITSDTVVTQEQNHTLTAIWD